MVLFVLAEAVVDQLAQGPESALLVVAVNVQIQLGAFAGGEHHDAHDAFAVGLLAVSAQSDIALELRGQADEFGRGTRVHAEFVDHCD
jgi:hypothetical protein